MALCVNQTGDNTTMSAKAMHITAWAIAVPMFLWLLLAGGTKVAGVNPLGELEAFAPYVFWIGLAELTAATLFLFPRTTVIGGLFLSAHLGGAILFHIIRAEPFFGPSIFTSFWFQSLLLAACWLVVFLRRPDLFGFR